MTRSGFSFEQTAKRWLQKKGYLVYRSYASKGANDLLAIIKSNVYGLSETLFIQCKRHKILPKISEYEHYGLLEKCAISGGKPFVMFKLQNKIRLMPLVEYEERYLELRKQHKKYLEQHPNNRQNVRTTNRRAGTTTKKTTPSRFRAGYPAKKAEQEVSL